MTIKNKCKMPPVKYNINGKLMTAGTGRIAAELTGYKFYLKFI
jgi:hypothetical protein